MLRDIIQSILKIIPDKVKSFLYEKIVCLFITPRYSNEQSTFSQAGEDAVIKFLLLDYGLDLSKISYLDIGARHPTNGSNTFLFYAKGSKGVCVDADKESIPLIRKLRPRDKVLNVGVSDSKKKSGYLYFMEGGGSTIDEEEFKRRKKIDSIENYISLKIPLLNINTLIKNNFKTYPTFLSIDIEGLDLLVLKSLNFDKYPISIICVETCIYSEYHIRPKDKSISKFLVSKGYEIYADTYVNTVFVNKKWFYK